MKKESVIKYYGTQKACAAALGLGKGAVSRWGDVIPLHQAYRLNLLTGGDLAVADPFFLKDSLLPKGGKSN
jgi:hypothetical protein